MQRRPRISHNIRCRLLQDPGLEESSSESPLASERVSVGLIELSRPTRDDPANVSSTCRIASKCVQIALCILLVSSRGDMLSSVHAPRNIIGEVSLHSGFHDRQNGYLLVRFGLQRRLYHVMYLNIVPLP